MEPVNEHSTNSSGGPDPTAAVRSLVEANAKSSQMLRDADNKFADAQAKHISDIASLRAAHEATVGKLREEYQEKIQRAESGRLDSIRQVDREEVAKTAVAANTAITTLAKQTTDLATTLSKQVSDTATAAEARGSAQYSDTNKRLSALELSSSEGKGKGSVADPQMEKLATLVETLARTQAAGSGKDAGINASWIVLLGAVSLISALAAAGSFIYSATRTTLAAPQPIIVQVPTNVPLPPTTVTTTATK